MTELVAIGECLVELMSDGPIDRAEAFTKGFGGDTCDAAIMATRLGTKCAYVSRVGDDAFGDYLIREWRAAKVDISAVARTDAFTGLLSRRFRRRNRRTSSTTAAGAPVQCFRHRTSPTVFPVRLASFT